jgi:hypothetical protein
MSFCVRISFLYRGGRHHSGSASSYNCNFHSCSLADSQSMLESKHDQRKDLSDFF